MTSCQICGRRRGLNKKGGVLHHHVHGRPCPGIGFPPIEQDDARLVEVLAIAQAADKQYSIELAGLFERRANYIDPALIDRASYAVSLSLRLERRLARHRAWPQRFARQMEKQGWGSPPPDYLAARMNDGL